MQVVTVSRRIDEGEKKGKEAKRTDKEERTNWEDFYFVI